MRFCRLVILIALAGSLALAGPPGISQASPTTFAVNSDLDQPDANEGDGICAATPSGLCTLRAAVMEANAHVGADTITLPAGTYGLNGSPPWALVPINEDLTINGAGIPNTTVRNNSFGGRTFEISAGVTAAISAMTITGGSGVIGGGIISNAGTLTLSSVKLTGMSPSPGSVVFNSQDSTLNITDATISANTLLGGGNNSATVTNHGTMTLERVEIVNNLGAAIRNAQPTTDVFPIATIKSTTIAKNNGLLLGSSVSNEGEMSLTNVTIHDNLGGTGASPGGVANSHTLTLQNTTISDNTVSGPTFPGASRNLRNSGSVTIANSIISGVDASCSGDAITSLGHNIDSGNTCGLAGSGDQVNTDPLLAPLTDNGGPTATRALLPGSPAIDHGTNTGCPTTDQRGQPRPRDGDGNTTLVCDVGAFELQNPYPSISSFTINSGQAATTSTSVTLNLTASASATEMRFSNDGTTWPVTWTALASQVPWTLTSGLETKTVYGQVRDAGGNLSAIVSDTILLTETIPPTVTSLVINGGALASTSTAVNLAIQATDTGGSNLSRMSFSNDGGATWSPEEPFAATKAWPLTTGDGVKTVQARVSDGAGNISQPGADTITLDTRFGTSYSISINNAAVWTNTVAVNLSIGAAPGTAKMMISNDGGFGGVAWEPYDSHKAWILDTFEDDAATMIVQMRFGDANGNELPNSRSFDNIILDIEPPSGSVAVGGSAAAASANQRDSQPSDPVSVQSPVWTVQLTASDTQSQTGMQMRLSNRADFAGAIWKPFTNTVTWDFTGGGTVYVQFKDGAGNLSQPYSKTLAGAPGPGTSPTTGCSPRPRVNVKLQKIDGTLRATLSTTGANNGIRAVRFDNFKTAIVDAGDQTNRTTPFAVSIPPGLEPTSLQFTIRRLPGAPTATVRLVVIDGCGEWSTLLGGGPNAWGP